MFLSPACLDVCVFVGRSQHSRQTHPNDQTNQKKPATQATKTEKRRQTRPSPRNRLRPRTKPDAAKDATSDKDKEHFDVTTWL